MPDRPRKTYPPALHPFLARSLAKIAAANILVAQRKFRMARLQLRWLEEDFSLPKGAVVKEFDKLVKRLAKVRRPQAPRRTLVSMLHEAFGLRKEGKDARAAQ